MRHLVWLGYKSLLLVCCVPFQGCPKLWHLTIELERLSQLQITHSSPLLALRSMELHTSRVTYLAKVIAYVSRLTFRVDVQKWVKVIDHVVWLQSSELWSRLLCSLQGQGHCLCSLTFSLQGQGHWLGSGTFSRQGQGHYLCSLTFCLHTVSRVKIIAYVK